MSIMKNLKRDILYLVSNITLLNIVKAIVGTISIINLVYMPIYTKSLLLLEDQICGLAMFLFILCGLVALFGIVRFDGRDLKKTLFSMASVSGTIVFGVWLINILMTAFYNQASLKGYYEIVAKSINFGIAICVCYGIGLASIIFAHFFAKKTSFFGEEE